MLPRRGFLLGTAAAAIPLGLGAEAMAQAGGSNATLLQRFVALNRHWGEFSTLIAAVQTAGLGGALGGRDLLTVFAPTDDAFAAIGLDAESVAELPADALTPILLYHVAAGARGAGGFGPRPTTLTMLDGNTAVVTRRRLFGEPNGLYIEQSRVVFPNLAARNGVIHVIDRVLQPPMEG